MDFRAPMLEQQIERLEHQQTDPQVDPNEEDWQLMQDAKEGTTGLLQRVKAGEEASTRQDKRYTHVDGEITSNAQKVATTVTIAVRWFDKNDKVVARQATPLFNLAPGETLPFGASTEKNPEIVRYDVTVDNAY